MSQHNERMSKYTINQRPLRLRYFEVFNSKHEALIREKQIKKMKSRKFIESLVNAWA